MGVAATLRILNDQGSFYLTLVSRQNITRTDEKNLQRTNRNLSHLLSRVKITFKGPRGAEHEELKELSPSFYQSIQ